MMIDILESDIEKKRRKQSQGQLAGHQNQLIRFIGKKKPASHPWLNLILYSSMQDPLIQLETLIIVIIIIMFSLPFFSCLVILSYS